MYLFTCGTYTCVRQARRGWSLSYAIILCLDLLGQGLSLSLDLGWQPTSPKNLPASAHCGAGVTDVSINARDLNSGPYAYLASTFPAEPFLQLCNIGSFCGDIILDWIPSSCCSEASFFFQ